VGIEHPRVADSKRHLRTLLRQDTRGLIVTMIHKFEDMPENINTRKNIFVLVDEAHRTTGGKLGNFLVGALPNATYLGFTGTPIDKTSYGRGTFIIFGKDDPPHGYLDKYSIAESIEEGTTVPLRYTLAPSELQVEREILDKEFLDLKETEGICDFDTLKKALEKAVNLRNMLKNEERITKTSRYIADHYKKYVEPLGYKAFVVAVDREACYLYKKALDNYLPKEYTTPVFSQYHGDPLDMAQYHLTKKEEKRVRKAFKNPDKQPKILIVTQKLLTGFDAPILYCMYLDKPMRDHVLLQAIARVNRPYEDEAGRKKSSGFVLDFVGIFDRLEKALAFDSRDIEGVVEDIEELKKRFSVLIEDAREEYLSLVEGKKRDKAVEGVLKHFLDEEKRHKYYQFFKEVSDIYDIISPDAFLRQYLEDFEQLTSIYRMLKEGYEGSVSIDKEFSEKTAQLVREHTKSGSIGLALEIFEINEKTLKKIEESHASDTEKVISLIQTIERLVREYGEKKPYLISIGERAEEVIKRYKQRQKTTQQTLEDIKGIITEINEAKIEEKQKKLSTDGFSIYWELKQKGIALPEENAAHIEEILQKFPYWRTSERHSRKVKQNLYNMLLKTGVGDISEVTDIAQSIMRMLKGGEE
jgi:type I restriction enzyme R subunit